jgi:two-component system, LytTR family, sensor kinase
MSVEGYSSIALAAEAGPRAGLLRGHVSRAWQEKSLTRLQLGLLIFLIWTAVGAFEAVPEMLKGFQGPVFFAKILDCWAWTLITLALLSIDRRLASTEQSIAGLVVKFLLLSIPFSLAHVFLAGLLYYPFPEIWWSPLRNSDFAVYYFIGGWVTYFAIVGILQAFQYYNRFLTGRLQLERVERSLIEARLNALRLHLEPHFLFNALNAISSEVAANPALACNMIADLGALLRRSLDCKDSAEITLAEELALLEHYLSIQRVRFGERLDIDIDVAPGLLTAMVPPMLLQPLVENAIRHGIERRMSGGRIVVSASQAGDRLHLEVTDDGAGLPRGWRMERATGHGLRVTLERLKALYPECGEEYLTVQRRRGEGTEVAIRIPLHGTGRHGAIA